MNAMRAGTPRRAAIAQAWADLGDGVAVFTGRDGAPLSRTVKRIIDPLVLRIRANPAYGLPLLDDETADGLRARIRGERERLAAAAGWFTLLKSHRRALRIRSGNAQELYFPLSYTLAAQYGAPAADADEIARREIAEVHADDESDAAHQLRAVLDDPAAIDDLRSRVARNWSASAADAVDAQQFLECLRIVLADAEQHSARTARQRAWATAIRTDAPGAWGLELRSADGGWPGRDLGLCELPQRRPGVLDDEGEGPGAPPLDRSVIARVRATLRRTRDRAALPDAGTLCRAEADRACAPWGLGAADGQAAFVAGITLALQLAPLQPDATPESDLGRRIQARLRKEAYVLHARRHLAEDAPLHPRQDGVVAELRDFARPYSARLWARLHGRDVAGEPNEDADDVRGLLDGIARSVSLDHRQRIKTMLGAA